MGHMERGDIEALFGRDQSVDYTQGYGHLLFSPLEMESDGVGKHKSRRISKQKTSDGQNNEPNGDVPEGMEDIFELYKAIREGVADDAQMQRGKQLCMTSQFDTSLPIDEMSEVSTSDGEDHDDDDDIMMMMFATAREKKRSRTILQRKWKTPLLQPR
ncbi:hypothetical protein BDBG_17403 [Blastomyces gilchristii SLH14081]|uniref:Uncharacterized protein n=1 Tax=Blastomyces gilchristii (strain SLH14081) TaxID=559298 RepID=A0A179US85_BLAGS|nr:uncharacterized protein BDBG_17403 [Blastomyces gilchristii SLH14081]OAT10710.1 hypothetical protein BDBG_17403 [Blastomyces gilchristii SLH14081]